MNRDSGKENENYYSGFWVSKEQGNLSYRGILSGVFPYSILRTGKFRVDRVVSLLTGCQ